jgi:hypothetical protein
MSDVIKQGRTTYSGVKFDEDGNLVCEVCGHGGK